MTLDEIEQAKQPITQTDMATGAPATTVAPTPFAPLAPQAPQEQAPATPANESDFGGLPTPQTPPNDIAATVGKGALDDQISTAKERLAKYDLAANDGKAKTLAILAAVFTKNFGPLLQLEEQKRKTRVANALMPEVVAINKLTAEGKWEEALNRATEVGTAAGARVPELAPFYQDIAKRISDKQKVWENLKGVYELAKNRITDPNDPRMPDIKAMKIAIDRRDSLSEGVVQKMFEQQQLKTQRLENVISKTSETTGLSTFETTPSAYKSDQFETYVGHTLAQAHGLNPVELADVMNNQPVKGVDKDKAAKIREDYNSIQYVNANLKLADKIPIDPTQILYLQRQGLSNEQIAQRLIGRDAASATIDDLIGRAKELQEAGYLAQINKNPYMPAAHGYMPVHAKADDPNHLRPAPLMTHQQVADSNGKFGLLPKEAVQQNTQALNALMGLSYIPMMFQERADPNSPFPSLSGPVAKLISDYTNIPINSHITISQVARAIVNSSMEELENTKLLPAKEVGRLKAMIESTFQTEKDALKATAIIKDRIYERINNHLGTQVEPATEKNKPTGVPTVMPSAVGGATGGAVTPTAAPTVAPTTTPTPTTVPAPTLPKGAVGTPGTTKPGTLR